MKKHQAVWPFREPVSKEDVPDYENIVRDPIDIKTIEVKLTSNEYQLNLLPVLLTAEVLDVIKISQ